MGALVPGHVTVTLWRHSPSRLGRSPGRSGNVLGWKETTHARPFLGHPRLAGQGRPRYPALWRQHVLRGGPLRRWHAARVGLWDREPWAGPDPNGVRPVPVHGHLLIRHTSLPPFFVPGNHWEIYGPQGFGLSLWDTLAGQVQYTYFPITLDQLGATAQAQYHKLVE